MTSFSTSRHPDDGSPHVRVSVFAGPDRDHRANVGILTFRRGDGEDDELIYRVEDRYLTAEVERLTAGRAFIQETLAQTLTRAETAEAKLKAVEALADEMGSGFPYVRVADIRRVLAEEIVPEMNRVDDRPHSRACGWRAHPHGSACAPDCPTCGGTS